MWITRLWTLRKVRVIRKACRAAGRAQCLLLKFLAAPARCSVGGPENWFRAAVSVTTVRPWRSPTNASSRPTQKNSSASCRVSTWPFHGAEFVDQAEARQWIGEGRYDGRDNRAFWITVAGERTGLVRLMDLCDDAPLFDLRIRSERRGRGIGGRTLTWLTGYVFIEFPRSSGSRAPLVKTT